MMRIIITVIFVGASIGLIAQVNIIPFAGVNSTRMYQSYGYEKGGTYGIAGLEIELRKKPKTQNSFYATLVTGLSYLNNGYYKSENFSYNAISLYTASITDRQMEYIQVPIILKLNWQPFPLVEDWKMFLGIGVSNSILLRAHLAESYTRVILNNDISAPPVTEHYEDKLNVTRLGVNHSLFTRIDVGMIYKRIQLSFRFSKAITNLYYTGLEKSWKVPADNSQYLKANTDNGGTFEKYTEIVVGYRLFK